MNTIKSLICSVFTLMPLINGSAQEIKTVKSDSEIRFLVVGDTQGNGRNGGYAAIVPQLIKDMEKRNPDFVIFTGDLVGTGSVKTLTDWKNLTTSFGNNRYMVPGNHDLPGRSATNQDWKTIFSWLPDSQEVNNITAMGSNDKIKGIDKMDYYFDPAPHIRIISVTTDRDAFKGEQHTHSGGYEIIGGEPKAMDWFQSVMALNSTKEKEWLFVMTHHPVTTMMSQYNAPEHFNLQAGTPSEWWKSITGQHPKYQLAKADALLTGHVHGYFPNHPDPNVHTAEMIIGSGGGRSGGVMHRRKNGFVEIIIKNGKANCTFIGDANDEKNGWSFTEVLDTFELTNQSSLAQGIKAFYQFEKENPTQDTSGNQLSKKHQLHFNQGATITKVRKRGYVLSLDGKAFADAKNVGDENLQLLNNLKLSLWVKACGKLGTEKLDNILLAYGDADSAEHNGTWLRTVDEEIANYAYILSYTKEGKLQMTWEYHDDPNADSPAKQMTVTSTKAVKKPKRWHKIKVIRDAKKKQILFFVDDKLLGDVVSFKELPTGAGTGSLYIGAIPNIEKDNHGGLSTFKGMIDDVLISNDISKEKISVTPPQSAYPSSGLKIGVHTDYTKKHYPERITWFKEHPLQKGDIVMIGNSITEGGRNWGERLNNPKVRNRGIGGDVSDGILHRLDEIIWSQPPAVFMLIGTNDVFSTNTVQTTVDNILTTVKRLRKESPKTKVYIQTVFPQNKDPELNSKVWGINMQLKAKQKDKLYTIIDTYTLLKDGKGLLKDEYTYDGIHLTKKGYEVWAEHLKTYIDTYKN